MATEDTETGMNLSMTPPCMVARVGLAWRLATCTPSTMTRPSAGMARTTLACLPRSLPVITWTLSPLRIRIYNTSGASETIRMKRLSRSSRPTGPKMRVPRGCCWSLMRTAAFSSKRM